MSSANETPTDGASKPGFNIPRASNPGEAASIVPPGVGELNYIQMLLKGILDQSLYTTSSPTFAGLTVSGLTASTLVGTNASKALQSVNPGTSLSLVGTALNTIQGIRTVDSPTFAGLTVGSGSGILKVLSGVVGVATIGTSLDYTAPTLNTIQGIRISDTPQFKGLTLLDTASMYPTINVGAIGRSAQLYYIRGTGKETWLGPSAGNTLDIWTNENILFRIATNNLERFRITADGFINIVLDAGLGIIDTNASHYLRLDCGSDLTADRILTFTTGDAARTVTLNGNPTLNDWFDQAVKAASTPSFAGVKLTTSPTVGRAWECSNVDGSGAWSTSPPIHNSAFGDEDILASQGVAAAPTSVTIAEQRIVGRITGGHITGLTAAQVTTLLGITGKLKQVVGNSTGAVATGTTTIPYDDTIPQQSTEGNLYLSQAITPVSATNNLIILVLINAYHSAGAAITAALFQDSTENALNDGMLAPTTLPTHKLLIHKMAAGTTSSTTFKVHVGGASAGTTTINGVAGARYGGGILLSGIIIMEVEP